MKWRVGAVVMLACLMSTSATASDCVVPTGWQPMSAPANAPVHAAIAPRSDGYPVSLPFELEFAICTAEDEMLERVVVDAVMPAHQHGMNYRPAVTRTGYGRYRAGTMLFHMPGAWRIHLTAYRGGEPVRLKLDVVAK